MDSAQEHPDGHALQHHRSRLELEQSAKELFDMVLSGKVKVEIGQTFPLEDAAEAHRALEARKTTGSTVFTV
jgi:NADPH2:quinone reductase